jgi:hypothetical protein
MSHREIRPGQSSYRHDNPNEHFLFEGIDYPVTKQDLVEIAQDAEYDQDTLNLVLSLPDQTYRSREDVWRSIGEAKRVFGGGQRDLGTPRDDLGKQATAPHGDGHVNRP